MNKYEKLFENWKEYHILLESRLSDAVEKAIKLVASKEEFDAYDKKETILNSVTEKVNEFAEHDPSGNNKYLDWMVSMYFSCSHEYDTNKIIGAVQDFHKLYQRMPKKNIYDYETIEDLTQDLEKVKEKKTKREKKIEVRNDSNKIYEDGEVVVVRLKSEEASCYYGKGTKWCISATRSKNYFNEYTRDKKVFYFIIPKNESDEGKIALVFTDTGWQESFLSNDSRISNSKVEGRYPDSIDKIVKAAEQDYEDDPPELNLKEEFEKECQEIQRKYNNMYSFSYINYSVDEGEGESVFANFSGGVSFDVPNSLKPYNEEIRWKVIDKLKKKNFVSEYYAEDEVYFDRDGNIILRVSPEDSATFSPDPSGFEDFADFIRDIDVERDEILYSSIKELVEEFDENIESLPKFYQLLNNLENFKKELKDFDIDYNTDDGEIEIITSPFETYKFLMEIDAPTFVDNSLRFNHFFLDILKSSEEKLYNLFKNSDVVYGSFLSIKPLWPTDSGKFEAKFAFYFSPKQSNEIIENKILLVKTLDEKRNDIENFLSKTAELFLKRKEGINFMKENLKEIDATVVVPNLGKITKEEAIKRLHNLLSDVAIKTKNNIAVEKELVSQIADFWSVLGMSDKQIREEYLKRLGQIDYANKKAASKQTHPYKDRLEKSKKANKGFVSKILNKINLEEIVQEILDEEEI